MTDRPGARRRTRIVAFHDGAEQVRDDWLATEEPLEIRLHANGVRRRLGVTMRTPGDDFALAAGFLVGEGVVTRRQEIRAIRYCVDRELDEDQRFNVVTVDLLRPPDADLDLLERHVTITSACGVCGRQAVDDLEARGVPPPVGDTPVEAEVLTALPGRLRDSQRVFDRTGGLHAAGVFTAAGELVALREDVGRHNALDKVVGWALLDGRLPLDDTIVGVSGRASYELVQKALVAGVPTLAAVGAPSTLAVDLAARFGMTLVGFLRGDRFNVYAGDHRVARPGETGRRASHPSGR